MKDVLLAWLKGVLVLAGLCAFVGVLLNFTLRGSLFLAFVPSAIVLWYWRCSLRRAAFLVAAVNLGLAAVPVDIGFDVTGHIGVDIRPILWGLPSDAGEEMIRRKEVYPGGCVVSAYPARYAVVFTR